jgi:hypothetical protein
VDEGALPAIVAAMKSHQIVAGVQEQACRALVNITGGLVLHKARAQKAVDAGALPAIVAAMKSHQGVVVVQEQACWALYSITAGTDDARGARAGSRAREGQWEARDSVVRVTTRVTFPLQPTFYSKLLLMVVHGIALHAATKSLLRMAPVAAAPLYGLPQYAKAAFASTTYALAALYSVGVASRSRWQARRKPARESVRQPHRLPLLNLTCIGIIGVPPSVMSSQHQDLPASCRELQVWKKSRSGSTSTCPPPRSRQGSALAMGPCPRETPSMRQSGTASKTTRPRLLRPLFSKLGAPPPSSRPRLRSGSHSAPARGHLLVGGCARAREPQALARPARTWQRTAGCRARGEASVSCQP